MTATVLSIARNIINQIGNEWSSRIPSPKWVEVRQATNDMLDAFVSDLIAHLEAEQATHIAELEAKLQSCYLQAALDHRAMTPKCDQCGRFTTNSETYDKWQPDPWNGPRTTRLCDRCTEQGEQA